MKVHVIFLLQLCALALGGVIIEQPWPNLSFSSPVDIQNDGFSTKMYVVQQTGRIYVFDSALPTPNATIFLDISSGFNLNTGGEKGLLGLAFHPNYQQNRLFYIYYIASGPLRTIVARFNAIEDFSRADPATHTVILTFNQPYDNHNGGQIQFGADGYLYIGAGDGGSGGDPQNHAQNTNDLLGKILRIDVNNPSGALAYGIPATNPFANGGGRGEVYAYGLRNPWRFSFDPPTGRLWVGDVGQNAWEEISIVPLGGNMGWKVLEGNHCYSPSNNCNRTGKVPAVFEYPHSAQRFPYGPSVTGGFVYRGSRAAEIYGQYIFADYGNGMIGALTYNENDPSDNTFSLVYDAPFQIATFGIDLNKDLYLASYDTGGIYRFSGTPGTPTTGSPQGTTGNSPGTTTGSTNQDTSQVTGSTVQVTGGTTDETTASGTVALTVGAVLSAICLFFTF